MAKNEANTNVNNEEEAKLKAEAEAKAKAEADAKAKEPKEYIVKTPVANFNGIVAGVQFAYGQAKVKEGWILNWFKEKGYEVEEAK